MIKKPVLWNEKIPFIKEAKEFYSKINYKGINLWPIMAGEVYMFQSFPIKNKSEKFFFILKFLFTIDKFNIHGRKGNIFVSYPDSREDHHTLLIKSIEKFPKKEITLLDNYNWKKNKSIFKYKFRFPNPILLFKIWKKFKKENIKKVFGKNYLYFLMRTYFRYKQIKILEKIYNKFNPKAHIAFCSQAFAEDTILTLLAKKNKKPTFTLEHGFIPNFSYFLPVSVILENMISDFFLVWGKRNYDIEKKFIDQKKLLLAGNPKYILNEKVLKKFNPKIATFFFSVIGSEKSNINIIKILNNFSKKHPNIQFNMKLHPFDSIENYKQYINSKNIKFVDTGLSVKELLEKSDFVILHNTSVAQETLLYNLPIFRFKDNFTQKIWGNFDTFKNEKEFENLFNNLKDKKFLLKHMRKYKMLLRNNFHFEKNKSPSQIYYEKISKIIKRGENK